jgi:hypothetical protein
MAMLLAAALQADTTWVHRGVYVAVHEDAPRRIEWEVVVPTTMDQMRKAWTDADELATWAGPAAAVDLPPGGDWHIYFDPAHRLENAVATRARSSVSCPAASCGSPRAPRSSFRPCAPKVGRDAQRVHDAFRTLSLTTSNPYHEGGESWQHRKRCRRR